MAQKVAIKKTKVAHLITYHVKLSNKSNIKHHSAMFFCVPPNNMQEKEQIPRDTFSITQLFASTKCTITIWSWHVKTSNSRLKRLFILSI